MDIFKDDLLKNKYFLSIAGILLIVAAYFYINNYNSLESQCRRRYKKLGGYFDTKTKIQDRLLESVLEQKIQECIENQGK